MNKKPNEPVSLRADAVAQLTRAPPASTPPTIPAEEILHELQVHQIELEMQNEQLRQAQLALEESRDHYVDLYEFAPVGYITLNHEGMIDKINLTAATLLGVERSKLPYRRFASFVAIEDRERWHRRFLSLLTRDDTLTYELALQRGDGTRLYARLNCLCLKQDDKKSGVRIALTDITERRQAEEALRKSNELLQTIVDNMPIWVFWKDRDSRYLGCNTLFAINSGRVHPDELIGKTDFEMVWAEQAELYRADDKTVMDSGMPKLGYEEPQTTLDGNLIRLRTSKVPLRGAEGKIIGMLGICEDITEFKQAESKLAEQLDELRRWHDATSGREGRILDLKHEVNELLARSGLPPRYPSAESQDQPED